MLHRYCPSCASVDIKNVGNGIEECARCGHRGEFREGAMDEINAYKRTLGKGIPSGQAEFSGKPLQKGDDLKSRLSSLKGKKTDDFEIL